MGKAAGRDALALARAVAARAGSLEELSPSRALGLSEEEVRRARAGHVRAGVLEHVSEAVAVLDIALAMGRGPRSRSAALTRCDERLESVEREVETAREALVRALRTRQSCAAEVARRSREREVVAQAAVLALVEQAERVLRLPRSVASEWSPGANRRTSRSARMRSSLTHMASHALLGVSVFAC